MSVDGIKTVAGIGTGAMGGGTVLCFAQAGYNVIMQGRSEEKLAEAMTTIDGFLAASKKHGLVAAEDVAVIRGRIKTTTDLNEAGRKADFLIESLSEDPQLKKEKFALLDKICPPHTIFSTNTSGLSPTDLASVVSDKRASQFVVMHLFNPPPFMPVAEIVPGRATSQATVDTTAKVVQSIGKEPVPLKVESPGFVVNVVQVAILSAAANLVTAGVSSAREVDRAVETGLNLRGMDIEKLINRNLNKERTPPQPSSPDFIVNSIKHAMIDASCGLVEAGIATPRVIDKAVKASLALRLPHTGPLASLDIGGLDVFEGIYKNMKIKPPDLIQAAIDNKHYGADAHKGGRGIYVWTPEELASTKTKRVEALIGYMKEGKAGTPAAAPEPGPRGIVPHPSGTMPGGLAPLG